MAHDSNIIVETELTNRLRAVENKLGSDVLAFSGPIVHPFDDYIRESLEGIPDKKSRLAVVLETTGGYVDSARRIAETLRHHYNHVDFIVASHAMSAGTVLAMSGDAIFMDYYSALGPIDPQIPREDGSGLVPALGYLVQFDRLVEKSARGGLTDAEMAFLLKRFDPGELYQYEQERELSVELLKQWLVQYKFKDWAVTETRKMPVTQEMRVERAEEIARGLNDTERWHSHSRGITMPILRDQLRLKIEDFEADGDLNAAVRGYHRLLQDYMGRRGDDIVIHTRTKYTGYSES